MKTKILIAALVVLSMGACAPHLYGSLPNYMTSKKLMTPTLGLFPYCQDYDCATVKNVELSKRDWKKIDKAFGKKAKNATEERAQIARTIGAFEKILGDITGTKDDKAGTFIQTGEGQLDCVDESTNTTVFMMLLDQKGLIKFHTVEQPQVRYPIVSGRGWMHQTAVLRETKTGDEYAMDSWFYDNGVDAQVIPIKVWLDGWHPEEAKKKQMAKGDKTP